MADRINDIIDVDGIKKQIDSAIAEIARLQKEMEKLGKEGLTMYKKGGSGGLSEMEKDAQKLVQAHEKLNAGISGTQKETIKLNQAQSELNRTTKLQVQAENDLIGAYDRLKAQTQLALNNYRNLVVTKGKDADETKRAAEESRRLNERMKEIDATVSLHQKNVGNYAGALGKTEQASLSLRTQMMNLQNTLGEMAMQGKSNTAEYQRMVMQLGQMKDAYGDVQARAKFFADDIRWITATTQAVQGLVGAYSVYQGVVALAGVENEELQKTMVKLQGAMTIMIGLTQVANALNKDSMARVGASIIFENAFTTSIQANTVAQVSNTAATEAGTVALETQNKVMKVSPWAIVLAAVVAVIAAMKIYANTVRDVVKVENMKTETVAESRKSIQEQITSLRNLQDIAKSSLRTDADRLKALDKIKEQTKGVVDIQDLSAESLLALDQQTNKYIGTLIKLANVQAAEERMVELAKENIDLQTEVIRIQNEVNDLRRDGSNFLLAANISLKEASILGYNSVKDLLSAITTGNIKQQDVFQSLIDLRTKDTKQQMENNKVLRETLGQYVLMNKTFDDVAEKTDGVTKSTKKLNEQFISIGDFAKEMKPGGALYFYRSPFEGIIDRQMITTINDVDVAIDELNISVSYLDQTFEELAKVDSFGQWIDNNMDGLQQWSDATITTVKAISSIMTDSYKLEDERAKKSYGTQTDLLKKKLDEGIITQEQYNQQSSALEDQYNREKAERDKKEYERRKTIAIAEATVNTALALIKIWSSEGSTATKLVMSIAQAATFAALISQMRTANAYAKGREDGGDEYAIVGEKGFEYVQTSTGELYRTPNEATMTYLRRGDKVYTHGESVEIDKMIRQPKVMTADTHRKRENLELIGKLDDVKNAIKNKPTVQFNISRAGVDALIRSGHSLTRHLNDNVKL